MAVRPRRRVFLDTNVIFSAFYSPTGPPAEILRLHIDGEIEAVVSQQVLEELARTIAAKLPSAVSLVQILLANAPPEVVPDPSRRAVKRWSRLVDPIDAPIVAAAAEAAVDHFITGDAGLLARAGESATRGLDIISPRQFVNQGERPPTPR